MQQRCTSGTPKKKQEAVEFLHNAVGYYAGLGVNVKRLLTGNG